MVLPAMRGINRSAEPGGEPTPGVGGHEGPAIEAATFASGRPPPAAEAEALPKRGASATVLGVPSPFLAQGPEAAAPPPQQRPPRAAAVTQLGVLDPKRMLEPLGPSPSQFPGPSGPPDRAAAKAPDPRGASGPLDGKSTVLGIGRPQASHDGPGRGPMVEDKLTSLGLGPSMAPFSPKIEEMPAAPNAARDPLSFDDRRTLPGVAVPGIAPVAGEGRRRAAVPQGQAAELDAAVREKARRVVGRRQRGVSGWAWALGGAGLIAVGGVVAALLVPGSAPLRAEVRLDEAGRDMLRVTCAKCPEGTKLSAAGGATVETKGGAADVPLGVPLKVGENELEIAVDRPGAGRDERVSLKVPLPFRIWADLRTLQDPAPVITVMVEAVAGSAVTLQGRPVSLDAEGRGREVFDVRDEVKGQRGEPATLTKQIPYTVAPKGGRLETGAVDVRVGVVPLALETPGPKLVTERPTFLLAGRTSKGSGVSVGGRALSVQPDGSFVQWMAISDEGTSEVEVRAVAPPLSPRLATVTVTRVRALAEEASRREQHGGPGYAEVAGAPEASVGRAVAWRGEVVEAANQGQRTVAVVSVRTGCKATPCLARTELSGPGAVARGDKIGLFGAVGGFAPLRDGKVPEIAAEFFVKLGGPRARAGSNKQQRKPVE